MAGLPFLHLRIAALPCAAAGLALLFAACAAPAATLELAGPGTLFEPVGLDADAVVREIPWALVNPVDSDSRYAPLPDWSAWRTVGDGLLRIEASVEGGASNAVWFAFGPEEAPALRIGFEAGRWHVLGGNTAVSTEPEGGAASPTEGVHRIAAELRTGGSLAEGSVVVRLRDAGGTWLPAPELTLTRLNWVAEAQHPGAWDAVRLSLRGADSAVSELKLQWNADPSLVLVR